MSQPVNVSPAAGMTFLSSVYAGSWRSALVSLNGTSMYEMLRLLDQIDRDDLFDLLNVMPTLNFSINVARIEFAASVVLDRKLPASVPADVQPQVADANTFLKKRSPLRIPRDPTGVYPAPIPNQTGLTADDYKDAAATLGCSEAAIHAVADVESGGRTGFSADGRPIIRYELHVFQRKTKKRFDKTHPHLSEAYKVGRTFHDGSQGNEWSMVYNATMLRGCEEEAAASASWGMFQIMGGNFKAAGYSSALEFACDTFYGSSVHLAAFVSFCSSLGLAKYLQNKDWAGFAKRYNGPDYATHHYDQHIASAYKAHGGT
jgi:hypothetical protein